MSDATFRNIIKLFVQSAKPGVSDTSRYSFDNYYMELAEIKDFCVLMNKKQFSKEPKKSKQELHEKIVKILNNYYTTENLHIYKRHINKKNTKLRYILQSADVKLL